MTKSNENFKKEYQRNADGNMIICSRRDTPAKLTKEEEKAIEDMTRFFLRKRNTSSR